MQEIIEKIIAAECFNMNSLFEEVSPIFSAEELFSDKLSILKNTLNQKNYKRFVSGILRHVFLIELVKLPKAGTTKFRTRWDSQLNGDPRQCSFAECLEIAQELISNLANICLDTPENIEIFNLFFDSNIIPYELPIDYLELPDINNKIHQKGNINWIFDQNIRKIIELRHYLISPQTSPDVKLFKEVLNKKIKTKTYLTDRVLTGIYKTNREKRWEVHPNSVHFSFRRVCMEIEYKLVRQLCAFKGFPENVIKILQNKEILPKTMEIYRCPITLEPLLFQEFREELMNPIHGKSNFQVGHLNPLKLDTPKNNISGHIPENIGWISANGNRIQGSMSLEEVRNLLKKIARNYENKGLV